MDLLLLNTIFNILWYIFTVLFVLYKFTSFFSYILNFGSFCYSLYKRTNNMIKYISNYNTQKQELLQNNTVSTNWYSNIYTKIQNKVNNVRDFIRKKNLQNKNTDRNIMDEQLEELMIEEQREWSNTRFYNSDPDPMATVYYSLPETELKNPFTSKEPSIELTVISEEFTSHPPFALL